MLDYGDRLLAPLPSQGYIELRRAIADHLAAFRDMRVDPRNILIGAGTDFLYNLLIQLLGREKIYALEEPGYQKIRQIYAAGGVECVSAPMDAQGILPQSLGSAQVLHCSPSHHFPTGIVTTAQRRGQLLQWVQAQPDRWLIEDDYDSEFRFHAHPLPALQSMDAQGRVIYMNTFSRRRPLHPHQLHGAPAPADGAVPPDAGILQSAPCPVSSSTPLPGFFRRGILKSTSTGCVNSTAAAAIW